MKIGTISINVNTLDLNYGAILHSWAFQQYLNKLGFENEIIDYRTDHIAGENLKYPLIYFFRIKRFKSAFIAIIKAFFHSKKYEKFEKYKNENMKLTKKKYTKDTLYKADLDYDVIICESDVIWDPNFFGGKYDETFFLTMKSKKKIRKIAYAASAANLEISSDQKREFNLLLQHFDEISCRESYLAEYISNTLSLKASCVLDPVFLLTCDDYKKITNPKIIEKPYLLLYTPVGFDKRIIIEAEKYAKTYSLKLIEVSSFPWDMVLHKTICDAGIEDFLSLIKYANVVFTNSFHAVCFSLIFHKEFYAFSRLTGRKIEDLCEKVRLSERFNKNGLRICDAINYDEVDSNIHKLVQDSKLFLERAICIDKHT